MPLLAPLLPESAVDRPMRITVDGYHQLMAAGLLTEDDRVELLEGSLYAKMPKNRRHVLVNERLVRLLEATLPAGQFVQSQNPITLAHSEPDPDVAIILGQPDNFPDTHPGPPHVLLVAEIADATLVRDRGIKLCAYARAAIPTYWIVDLADGRIEQYRDADPENETYRSRTTLGPGERLTLAEGRSIAVADVFAL